MDEARLERRVNEIWNDAVVPELIEYIRIPNKSPAFDQDWAEHGYMDEVVRRFVHWAGTAGVSGLAVEVVRLPGRTPLIYMETGGGDECVLLYGHLDKQPEMTGWRAGLGPWSPVIEDGRLYGRGGADDGYAMFASLTAIAALEEQGIEHARCVVLIESCEESGSFDLPHYIDLLSARIGTPSLVICLDSGCGNYDQMWVTTSLRGLVGGVLSVAVLSEGVHSGDASGIVPGAFQVLRVLLERVEAAGSGAIPAPEFNAEIPPRRREEAGIAAEVLGDAVHARFPFLDGVQPVSRDPADLVLNRTWRPALSITGVSGLPEIAQAGNVALPAAALKLSLRLPPDCDGIRASTALQHLLEAHPPAGAHVRFVADWAATGWNAPATSPWLARSLDRASHAFFGRSVVYMGEGGTIPFMAMLGARFPLAQFVVTGVLGPLANAHGPNEFLHLATARRLTCCIARILADHVYRFEESPA